MLEYILDNRKMVLERNTSVRLSWRSPACQFDEISGDAGLGIDIPVNDTNRALLGNPERFDKYRSDNDREFEDFEIRFSGVLLMRGTLIIQNANKKQYTGWLRGNTGNLKKEHQEKYIYDIDAFDETITWENKADYDPDVDDYGCPTIFNPDFFYDKGVKVKLKRDIENPDYEDRWWLPAWLEQSPYIQEEYETEALTEAFRLSANWFVNWRNPDNTIKTAYSSKRATLIHKLPALETYVVSPMLFLNGVLDKLLRNSNFFIDNNAIADKNDLKNLIIYNNYDITTIQFSADDAIAIFDTSADGVIYSTTAPVTVITRNYNGTFKYKNLLPKIKLKDFLLGVQNLLNVCFFFRKDMKVDIIDRESILTGDVIDLDAYMLNDWEIGEKKDVTLKFTFKHDSDDTVFSEKWNDIDDRREDIGEPVTDIEDLQDIVSPYLGEIRYVTSVNQYWQYNWVITEEENVNSEDTDQTDSLGWQIISIGLQNGYYNFGKEEEEKIETPFSTVFGDQTVMTQQKGNIDSIKYSYQNFSPRLLFYLGNNQAKYETENEGVLMDNYALDWEKAESGLLAMRWPKWARFWSSRQPVTGKAILPLNVLDYVTRNICSKFRMQAGEFIIEELECEFTSYAIGETTIKGYKI